MESRICAACLMENIFCITEVQQNELISIMNFSSLIITDMWLEILREVSESVKIVYFDWENHPKGMNVEIAHSKDFDLFQDSRISLKMSMNPCAQHLNDAKGLTMESKTFSHCQMMENPITSACSLSGQISIILTPTRVHNLKEQLHSAVSQSLSPKEIHVLQFEEHSGFDDLVSQFQYSNPHIAIHLGKFDPDVPRIVRFHLAYMLDTEYVSMWDNDVVPGNEWLLKSMKYSAETKHSLIGLKGYRIVKLMSGKDKQIILQRVYSGQVDFVEDLFTIRREYLRFYFHSDRLRISTHTADLSFLLQQQHIAVRIINQTILDNASRHEDCMEEVVEDQDNLAYCQLLLKGLNASACLNCNRERIEACIGHFSIKREMKDHLFRFQRCESSHLGSPFSCNSERNAIFLYETYLDLLRIANLVRVLQENQNLHIIVISVGGEESVTWYSDLFGNTSDHHLVQRSIVPSVSYASRLSRLMKSLRGATKCRHGDLIFFVGNTLSAFALALVGYDCHASIFHIAGNDEKSSGFMEQLLLLAHHHFALTPGQADHMSMRGVDSERILTIGNICQDVMNLFGFQMIRPQKFSQFVVENDKIVLVCLSRVTNYDRMITIVGEMASSIASNLLFVVYAQNEWVPDEINYLCIREAGFICVGKMSQGERLWLISKSTFVLTDNLMIAEETRCFLKPALIFSQDPTKHCFFEGNTAPFDCENGFEIQKMIIDIITSTSDSYDEVHATKANHATQTVYEFLIRKLYMSESKVIYDSKRGINSNVSPSSYTLQIDFQAENQYQVHQELSSTLLSLWITEGLVVVLDLECKLSATRGKSTCDSCACVGFQSTEGRAEDVGDSQPSAKVSYDFSFALRHTESTMDGLVLVISKEFSELDDERQIAAWTEKISIVQKKIFICVTNVTNDFHPEVYEMSWIYKLIDPNLWKLERMFDGRALNSSFIIYVHARKTRSSYKNLCWIFGQYGRLNNGIIGLFHLAFLASRFQRQMVLPDVAFVGSLNLPITSLLDLEELIHLQGYDIKFEIAEDFFHKCGTSPAVDVKGLEEMRDSETVQIDARALFDSRNITVRHMKSSFSHLRFHSRLVEKAQKFILEIFGGIPFAAVHFRNFEEHCDERVRDLVGHAYPAASNISSYVRSISSMCNPNVSWVLDEAEGYTRIPRIRLFVSTERFEENTQSYVSIAHRLVKPDRDCEEVECALIDMIICMESIIFFGNPASTFSLNVARLREQQFQFAGPNVFSTDRTSSFPLWFGYR
eukprot:767689-Hanusia_phi.AAC.4